MRLRITKFRAAGDDADSNEADDGAAEAGSNADAGVHKNNDSNAAE